MPETIIPYKDQLLDKRWFIKRKRILQRDGFKCVLCDSHSNLNVHHKYYYNTNTSPWDYPDSGLVTLCKSCHENHHQQNELRVIEFNENMKRRVRELLPNIHVRKTKKRPKTEVVDGVRYKIYYTKQPKMCLAEQQRYGSGG